MNLGWEKLIQTEGPNPDATEQDQNNDLCMKSKRGTKAALGQRQNKNLLLSGVLRGKNENTMVKKTERAHSSQD
jgi:hypothetical protein